MVTMQCRSHSLSVPGLGLRVQGYRGKGLGLRVIGVRV